jgi:CubicO group peptidase (beta-lactamase class C family)
MGQARITRRSFLRVLAAAFGTSLALPSKPPWGVQAWEPEDLTGLLEPIRTSYGMPALAAAFVQGSDLRALGAVGTRRRGGMEPVTPDDLFHIGSCTKSMTATLLATFVEEGHLSWETTIAEVFPDLLPDIHPGFHGVTLRQLLSHRGGLPDDRIPDPAIWPQVRALSGPLPQQRLALMRLVLARPPAAEPGTEFHYSNFGYTIAGAFAERIAGEPWEDLMRKGLFEPLGMTVTGFGPPGTEGAEVPDQPWGHTPAGCEPVPPGPLADNPPVIGPAGTVHSSLRDWARYALLHLLGARGEPGLLLTPETFRQLHRDHYRQGYALGWIVVQRPWAGGTALTHAGSNGLWFAVIWLAPQRNAGFLAATNCGSDRGFQACDTAIAAMIRQYLSS